jgi:hypothetical protein
MTTKEKIKLLTDARDAIRTLDRVLDGGHNLESLQTLRNDCFDALGSLSMAAVNLVAEIGTDNLA